MAAGLGFKDFVTGEVLTAADVDGYLMQGVWVFANAAARTAAVTSPQEGNASFLKDTNSLEIYDGAAWVAYGAGDITGVTAGTGISGGGTSGTVTVTNSMATEIAAKGDLIVGTGSATFDNLTVGANGTVLTADSTVSPTGLKWATPGGSTFVGCSAYKSANQSISNNTYTSITFDLEFYDTDSIHNTSTNTTRFTVPSGKGGKWLLTGFINIAANSTGNRLARLLKNGATLSYPAFEAPLPSESTNLSFSVIYDLVAADYLEIQVFQTSGISLNVFSGTEETNIQFTYLGA